MANPKFLKHLLPAPKKPRSELQTTYAKEYLLRNKKTKPSKWGTNGGTIQGRLEFILASLRGNDTFTAMEVGKLGNWTALTAANYLKQREDVQYDRKMQVWRFI